MMEGVPENDNTQFWGGVLLQERHRAWGWGTHGGLPLSPDTWKADVWVSLQ